MQQQHHPSQQQKQQQRDVQVVDQGNNESGRRGDKEGDKQGDKQSGRAPMRTKALQPVDQRSLNPSDTGTGPSTAALAAAPNGQAGRRGATNTAGDGASDRKEEEGAIRKDYGRDAGAIAEATDAASEAVTRDGRANQGGQRPADVEATVNGGVPRGGVDERGMAGGGACSGAQLDRVGSRRREGEKAVRKEQQLSDSSEQSELFMHYEASARRYLRRL